LSFAKYKQYTLYRFFGIPRILRGALGRYATPPLLKPTTIL